MDSNHSVVGILEFRSDAELAAIELYKDYSPSLLQFAFASCIIFMLCGIPGNLITIIALWSCKKFQNATAIFIINLHISNLIFCCVILPMTAVNFSENHWIFGKTMCSVHPMLKYALVAVAHFTVVAITVNRCVLVCHPLIYSRLYNRKVLLITLMAIWAGGFALFIPSFFEVWGRYDLDVRGGNCSMIPDRQNVNPKTLLVCLAFTGPYIIISVCYGRIWWTVRKTTKNSKNRNAKAIHPGINPIGTDPSAAENGHALEELTVDDSSDCNRHNSSIALTPSGRESGVVNFFKKSFRRTRRENKLHLPTRKDKKLATMILAIIVSFTMCHLPLMMTRIIYGNYKSDPIANILAHLLEYCTTFISPVIYVIMSSEYRQAYKSLFENWKTKIMELFDREIT